MTVEVLRGEAKVIELADRMRRAGGGESHRLYHECVEAFRRGEIEFDRVTVAFRHALIHAGHTKPSRRSRFMICPQCEAFLDVPTAE